MDAVAHPNPESPRWLNATEMETWLSLWSVLEWLPGRLDAQLKAEAGLSLPEYNALSQLSMAPDRSMRMGELAEVANMKLPHLSRVATRMEAAGWVVRAPDAVDGRFMIATLTEAGIAKVVATAPGHVAAVRRFVFDALDADQVAPLGAAAARIAEAIAAPHIRSATGE